MNMQRMMSLSALALTVLVSSTALAEVPLTGTQIQVDADYAWVLLLSPSELPEPSLRISRGEVKLWFSGVDHERLTQPGDGLAFRDVRIRAGAGDSAVVHIRLGDRRELSTDDITVVPFDGGSAVRFRRGALPQRPPEMNVPAGNAELAEETAALVAGLGEAAEAEAGTENEAEEEAVHAQPLLLATETEGALAGGILEGQEESRGSPVGILLLITALLGGLLLVVRLVVSRRKGISVVPDIDVVSTKRIGPRHQLIVVRALGEEHLLSVNGTQTQLITSVSQDSPEEMIRLSGPRPSTAPTANNDTPPPVSFVMPTASKVSSDERFGARLLDLASRRTDTTSTPASASPSPTSAVAGLLELRRRLS
ncbi:MAG: flagellar biogenesis protein FliO [Polyangiales bacterium]|jgi:flagellar biogenesis protein FliO